MVSPILMGPRNFQASLANGSSTRSATIAGRQPLLDGEPEEAVGDPLAELGGLHVLGVGVEHVVVAGQPGEEDDVGLADRPARRDELLADLDVVEADRVGVAHGGIG